MADLSHVHELFQEYAEQIGIRISPDLDDYAAPRGCIHIHYENGQPAACAAIRPLTPSICELKRLYVRPAYRSRRLGRRLAERMIEEARAMEYETMRLDTMPFMREAIALYRKLGFREIEPYRPDGVEGMLYFELSISRTCSTNCREV